MTVQKRGPDSELPAFDDPADLVNAVISTLQAPEEKTNVAMDFANDRNAATEVQAYAKIAGRDWTYYVRSLAISIGRNTDAAPPPSPPPVQIDLGPAKVVSRQHATITYNIDLRCWELKVLGRNGARVDSGKMPVGAAHATPLHSGAILDIGGTQMMFILPDTPPSISEKMLAACLARYDRHKMPRPAPHAPAAGFHALSNFHMFDKGSMAHSHPQVSAVSLQSNLDQDLSKEDSKDIKPPYSYATMITQAILSNADGVMSLAEIYSWISSHYAYYKYSKTGWQNSIRHNLSLNKAFEKVPRRPNEPGKGMKWQISEAYRSDFLKKVQTGTLSKSRRGSSVSRTLQIHLATHQNLPEAKSYPKPRNGSVDHQQKNALPYPMAAPYPPMQNAYQMPYGGAYQPPRGMAYGGAPAGYDKPLELASPMRNADVKAPPAMYAMDAQKHAMYQPYAGVNLYKAPAEAAEAAPHPHSFTSNHTSEVNSTAPTSNASDLGLGFTSPKKIAPLEAFTPERGSKNLAGKVASQSSPAFWNFVQFSTPNGQTPGRKNSDGSPTNRGPKRPDLYNDSPYDTGAPDAKAE